jgi:hypothetical protein
MMPCSGRVVPSITARCSSSWSAVAVMCTAGAPLSPAQEDIGGIERHVQVRGLGLEDLAGEGPQRGSRGGGGVQDQLVVHVGTLTGGAGISALSG